MVAISNIRNIGIIAHIDAGKTTLSERILYYSRKIHRMGEVHDGAATMDFLPEEQERGITISSACTSCTWQDCQINLVDTPGHVDFSIEVERCLRVLDGAVGVFCAVGGVEPQSETVWKQSEHFNVPKIIFINKIDRQGANFFATIDAINERLAAGAIPITIPAKGDDQSMAIIDLINLVNLHFDDNTLGSTVIRSPLNGEDLALAELWRDKILEQLAEADDTFLSLWMENAYTTQDIQAALRRATLARKLAPTLCGAALRNVGVQPLLDAITAYLPSPLDVLPPEGCSPEGHSIPVTVDAQSPLTALVFKVLAEQGRKTALLRLYSGTLSSGDALFNVNREKMERAGQLFALHADRRSPIDRAHAGEIVALTGLRHAHTGETYTTPGQKILLESIAIHPPVMTLALEVRNADEGSVLDEALGRYTDEDPTLLVHLDDDSGCRILRGMGELHLAVVLERLQREYGISPRAGRPQVIFRESILRQAEAECLMDKDLGKEHHAAHVALTVAPRSRGAGNEICFAEDLPPTPVMRESIQEGVKDALQSGVLTAWPVVDVSVRISLMEPVNDKLTGPGCHMAALAATREALNKGKPVALEPIMRVEISTPEDFMGACISLLSTCKGKVDAVDEAGGGQKCVRALAPLGQLFGFSTALRSATQGRAGFTMSFDSFDIPHDK